MAAPRALKVRLFAFVACVAAGVAALRPSPLPYDVSAVAGALGTESGTTVEPRDIRWEPSRGALVDALFGRRVVFLGMLPKDKTRDLFRAAVRVTPEGTPLGVSSVTNLTNTALGDDHALVLHGDKVAYATFAFGLEQSVTFLDLAGEGSQNTTEKLPDRAMAYVTNVQQTGTGAGIARVDVTFDEPTEQVGLSLDDKTLRIEARGPSGSVHANLDTATRELQGEKAHAENARHLPKRLVFWAVDTVRAVPWIGPAPIAWLEERTFAVRDAMRQASFKASGGGDEVVRPVEAPRLELNQAALDADPWPPQAMRSIWKTPEPHEGEWTVPEVSYLKGLGGDAPPAFMRAFVRPDEERAYAKVLLVAMDMRQLDLDMEAGVEDPKPLTGPPGSGRIPRDPKIFKRVAAAFNGGFKTEHGSYGMMVKKRVLLPPVAGAASLILLKDGRVGMGSWGNTTKVSGIKNVPDDSILSFRQNLDPLLANDTVNPSGRGLWGFTLPGTSMQTERSGVCVTTQGHLIYAWGDDVSATTLGKAMKMAGCAYGMHLDMNPHHTGLIFTNITDVKGKNWKSELLTNKMEISADRYIEYAPKDFFYMMVKEVEPPSTPGIAWLADSGAQPPPKWMPAFYRAKVGDVELLSLERGRAGFRVRAGEGEPTKAALPQELEAEDKKRVLLAMTMGAPSDKRPRGLSVDGKVAMLVSREEGLAVLSVDKDGRLAISDKAEEGAVDVVELPLLLKDGEPAHGAAHGNVHGAVGLTADGRTVFATSQSGSAKAVTDALKSAGCTHAVALDRGQGKGGALFRTGTADAPRVRYAETSLSVLARPMRPPAFVFDAETPVEPPKKKK